MCSLSLSLYTLSSLEVDLRDLYTTIYFQRDLLLTNLLSTRSTSNDGFEDAQRDLLSTRSIFNDTYTYTHLYIYTYIHICICTYIHTYIVGASS